MSETGVVFILLGEGKSFRSAEDRNAWAQTRLLSLGCRNPQILVDTPEAWIAEAQTQAQRSVEIDPAARAMFDSEGLDFTCLPSSLYFAKKKLAAFDLDSTLINAEGIDEFGREMGVYDRIAEITEKAMRGELDFEASFRARVKILQGLTLTQVDQVADRIALNPGVQETLEGLQKRGIEIAILSGGFSILARVIQKRFKIDHLITNRMEFKDGVSTGEPRLPIIDGLGKKNALLEIMRDQGLDSSEVVAIGDGANDIPMIQTAGIGVAFRGKKALRDQATLNLDHRPLDDVLYLFP